MDNEYEEQLPHDHADYDDEDWDDRTEEEIAAAERADNIEWARMNGINPFKPAMTMGDLLRRPSPAVRAYCDKLIYAGALTLIGGDPKAGKSTLMFHLTNAVSRGESFMDMKCHKAKVLYISEQNENSIKEQLRKIPKLADNEDLFMLLVEHNHGYEPSGAMVNGAYQTLVNKDGTPQMRPRAFANWTEQIGFWREMLDKTQANVLVIDTLVGFANLKSGESFDPGVMTRYFMELKGLFGVNRQLAIVVLHHLRKENQQKGGDHNIRNFSDIAGSYALRAATDQNILLFKPDETNTNTRCIKIEGRFGTFDDIALRLSEDQSEYELVPETVFNADARIGSEAQDKLAMFLAMHPEFADKSIRAIEAASGVSKSVVQRYKSTLGQNAQ